MSDRHKATNARGDAWSSKGSKATGREVRAVSKEGIRRLKERGASAELLKAARRPGRG